ncbi:unnamed protein product [Effrenium voratum]|uniref:FHA domain-containing protein n=1 Tax=Effrenium voratum TaxID=2562239 RepID=A0AA36MXB7_9DINO|nr:unnamed protein product [Effrenium voratum]
MDVEPELQLRIRSFQDAFILRSGGPMLIGRKDCDIEVKHPSVSARHASIEFAPLAEDGLSPQVLVTDLSSTNGTFAGEQPAGTRVPPEGARLVIGNYLRFGFCPFIYRLEAVPRAGLETEAASSSRAERRQQQLQFAETSYLGWLTQVREEYAARDKAEVGAPASPSPSLQELEATCTAFLQRPLSRSLAGPARCGSAVSRSSGLSYTLAPRPATIAGTSEVQVDTLDGVEPSQAEIEEEVERLAGRSWEVCSILRPPLSSAADLEAVEGQIQEGLTFITESLPRLAAELGQAMLGASFQGLLARGAVSAPGHAGRERLSSDALGAGSEVSKLVLAAEQLIGLLRVKIEDDADLALARTVLEDSSRFFADLELCAKLGAPRAMPSQRGERAR